MALAPNIINEIVQLFRATPGEQAVIDLGNGRKAYCFRGPNAAAEARDLHSSTPSLPISGVLELQPDTYAFVV